MYVWSLESFWLFQVYGAHRDLHVLTHTFPPRRSSDLSAAPTRAKASSDSGDLTSLLIGVNNQYRGRGMDDYRDEFAALLERAIGHAGGRAGRVLVLSIPDWGVTPFAAREGRDGAQVAREIDAFNAAARDTCGERGVAFVDITAASRGGGGDAGMRSEEHTSELQS